MLRAFLELTPIILAVIAILITSKNYKLNLNKGMGIVPLLSIVCALLLVFAQSSWYVLAVVMNSLEDTIISNIVWTIFNILTMVLLIVINKKT